MRQTRVDVNGRHFRETDDERLAGVVEFVNRLMLNGEVLVPLFGVIRAARDIDDG